MDEDAIRVRIQYINDLDPFVSTSNREPLKPLQYYFNIHTPIGEYLVDICRQLRAPHKSGDAALQVSPSACGDLGAYLDADLSLSEQPDELQILQSDPELNFLKGTEFPKGPSLSKGSEYPQGPNYLRGSEFARDPQKVNDIRPLEMKWKPSCVPSSEASLKENDFQKNSSIAVDEREKNCRRRGRRKIETDCLRSSLVLRQQPALRVKAIVDKLLHMSGRDQRRALFALKQIFQDDKDLVHEFVQSDGLDCLVRLGRISDQNHQNYILRALGQLMLYVDGMNGIIVHNETIQWLYELLDSPYRLVVKTALKLLLVFVEYTEANSLLLLAAISKVEKFKQRQDWHSIIRILSERGAGDDEMLIFAMTIINKTLNGVPDQDTFFDVIDTLEAQGFEAIVKNLMKVSNPQLVQQVELYDRELKKEDALLEDSDSSEGNNVVKMRMTSSNVQRDLGNTLQRDLGATAERRSLMRRRQQEAEDLQRFNKNLNKISQQLETKDVDQGYGSISNGSILNGYSPRSEEQVSPGWRKKEVSELPSPSGSSDNENKFIENGTKFIENGSKFIENESKFIENNNHINVRENGTTPNKIKMVEETEEKENLLEDKKEVKAPPPMVPNIFSPTEHKTMSFPEPETPKEEPKEEPRGGSKDNARGAEDDEDEGVTNCFAAALRKRAQKMENSQFRRNLVENKNEADIKWKEAAEKLKEKPMIINDLDFSEFVEFEQDPLVLVRNAQYEQDKFGNGVPPPPHVFHGIVPPPPLPNGAVPPPPPLLGNKGREQSLADKGPISAVKLHWKPAQAEALPIPMLKRKGTFWNKVETTPSIDTSKLARLFEQKTKEVSIKKAGEVSKPQYLQVLSTKRSQAIAIGLTKLPPVSVIPTAIRKFDTTVLNKEGIEKILQTMMPHSEEIEKIQEKQAENPDLPLGQSEQFLLSLSEIDCLLERLKLWLFMLDYQNIEKDVAESLMELNNAMKEVEDSETFRVAMGMLLSIGNALNGTDIKAFQLEYLSKAGEVKDPVHKYPLTYHLSEYMLDNYPVGTDLHSEFGAVSRSSKIDFDAVLENLKKMEIDCKNCWNYVAKISQKDNNTNMKNKINNYLTEVAERIHRLKHVHRTTVNRWNAFLLYFGYGASEIKDQKPMTVFKMVNEFALEYRTNREKILQMRKRMAEKRERNKTRGMMIGVAQKQAANVVEGVKKKIPEPMSDQERHLAMSQMLSTQGEDTLNRRRGQPTPERNIIVAQTEAMKKSPGDPDACDDELLDGVVRTVTATADSRTHERRRARQFNRKSRSYMELMMVIMSKVSLPLEHFYNQSMNLHYGISLDEAGVIRTFAIMENLAFVGSILSTIIFVPKMDSWVGGISLILGFYFTSIEAAAFGFFCFGMERPLRTGVTKLYIGECAPNEIRGFCVLAILIIAKTTGTAFQFLALEQIFGTDSRWVLLVMFVVVLAVIYMAFGYFIPESPKLMRMHNRSEEEITRTIKLFRGKDVDPASVLDEFDREISLTKNSHYSIRQLFSDPALFSSFKLIFFATVASCVGANQIIFFNSILLKLRYGFSNSDAVLFDSICGFLFLPLNLSIPFLVEKIGRRPLIIFTILINFISSIVIFFTQLIFSFTGPNLITVILSGIFSIFSFAMSSMGIGIFGILLITDLLPVNAKASATQISIISGNIISIVVNFYFSNCDPILGAFVHIPFAVFQFFFLTYFWKKLPETKKKAIYENYEGIRSRAVSMNNPQNKILISPEDKEYGTFDN
ncbi:hypothetical protein FO519_007927 [Halicephalobus sp. NKZ332]|nr:hypothetical protein FO519_007927 [Halicephalobus sp. NKZ332]